MPRTKHFDSTSVPGAAFDLRTVGIGFRHRMDLDMAGMRYKQSDLLGQYRGIITDFDAFRADQQAAMAKLTPDQQTQLQKLDYQSALAAQDIRIEVAKRLLVTLTLPEYLKEEGVSSFDDVLEYGPASLSEEIMNAAQDMYGMNGEQQKNSEPPSISQEAMDGGTTDTTAKSASATGSTGSATAAATSPTTFDSGLQP